MRTFLVIGAGGQQGGAVARHLAGQGHAVRGLSRTAGRIPQGVEPFTADLGDLSALKAAFTGVTHVSVTLPMVYDAPLVDSYVRHLVDAALANDVERLVFNTTTRYPAGGTGLAAWETRRAAARAFLESGVPAVVLRPSVYLDNLLGPWTWGPLVREGVLRYPLPAGLPVAWANHADLAAATAAALTAPGVEGSVVDLGASPPMTGAELAPLFGEALGREVGYETLDPEEFEAGLAGVLGAGTARTVADTYRWIASHADAEFYEGVAREGVWEALAPATPVRDWIAGRPWEALG
ncbi:SDR family oxidoreductase [Thermoactinospora rubra]|uniref:SDR family oxidoreductase n=1 Tax=Thermoactinospora rubra TaxID=1088767 RepID=UPI000A103424|nr:NmrA family NAD(P)-binding protein [Thermoactinospora rubra]